MQIVYFVHVLGALMVGFYLIFPFIVSALRTMTAPAGYGYARGIRRLNTIGQWLLIAQFFSGGYLIGAIKGFSVPWMISVVVIFLLLGAASGMIGASLKRVVTATQSGNANSVLPRGDAQKAFIWSIVAAASVAFLTTSMFFPRIL